MIESNICTINLTHDKSSYPILIGSSAITKLTKCIPNNIQHIVIISDSNLEYLYVSEIKSLLSGEYIVHTIIFSAGEYSKTREVKSQIEDKMLELELNRHDSLIIALGGGVVGDLAGFVAATYLRGIDFIQIPTSLLAMLDSSVGGKNGINTIHGKNLIGTIHQPIAVICDISYLKNLPKKELFNGFFEAVKIFLTMDEQQFRYIHANLAKLEQLDNDFIHQVIYNAVKLKARVVMNDEKEHDFRMILNFGHSVGHALEKLSNYSLAHGIAVGIGMLVEARVAFFVNELSSNALNEVSILLFKLINDLTPLNAFTPKAIINAMKNDKKNQNGKIRMVLLNKIGAVKMIHQCVVFEVEEAIIEQAIIDVGQYENSYRSCI